MPILNASDVTASIAWFESLGWTAALMGPAESSDPGFGGMHGRPAALPASDGVRMSRWLDSPAEIPALGHVVTYPPTDEPRGPAGSICAIPTAI